MEDNAMILINIDNIKSLDQVYELSTRYQTACQALGLTPEDCCWRGDGNYYADPFSEHGRKVLSIWDKKEELDQQLEGELKIKLENMVKEMGLL